MHTTIKETSFQLNTIKVYWVDKFLLKLVLKGSDNDPSLVVVENSKNSEMQEPLRLLIKHAFTTKSGQMGNNVAEHR